jgi:hypothetical protein
MINRYSHLSSVLFSALFIILFFVVAFLFSFQQNLWVDEATQLSGITLSFVDVYRWLGGLMATPFSVPSDRMPVLSYWFGMLWSELFSTEPLVMRWASLFLVVTSLTLLACYFLRKKQYVVLAFSVVFLCLSPNLTILAVEIRAYALFFLFSVLSVLLYVHIILCVEKQQDVFLSMLALSLVLVLAMNAHFFGVVLAGSLLTAYLLMAIVDRRFVLNIKLIFTVGAILLIGVSFVVLPVIAAFTSQSGSAELTSSGFSLAAVFRSAIKLIYRLVAHQTMGEVMLLTPIALAVVYGVITISIVKRPSVIKTTLLLALLVGATTVLVAKVFLSRFDALAPHYNIWMLPVLAILFAYAVNDLFIGKPILKVVVLGLLVLSCGYGQWTLAFSGEKYAHTRFSEIKQRVDAYSRDSRVTIIYNKAMAKTWFAGLYSFPNPVRQLIAEPLSDAQNTQSYTDLRSGEAVALVEVEQFSDVIVSVYGENIYSAELSAGESSAALPKDHSAFTQVGLLSPIWEPVNAIAYLAQESANIVVYKKTP